MNDKLTAIMETFEKLNHGEQVELFLGIKEELLKNRAQRIEAHSKELEYQKENISALHQGNDMIAGTPTSLAAKAGN